jgi:hypothetical protein
VGEAHQVVRLSNDTDARYEISAAGCASKNPWCEDLTLREYYASMAEIIEEGRIGNPGKAVRATEEDGRGSVPTFP